MPRSIFENGKLFLALRDTRVMQTNIFRWWGEPRIVPAGTIAKLNELYNLAHGYYVILEFDDGWLGRVGQRYSSDWRSVSPLEALASQAEEDTDASSSSHAE